MKILREVEIDISDIDVDQAVMEASPFDRLCMVLRLAKTIKREDIEEIRKIIPFCLNDKQIQPLKNLLSYLEQNKC